MESHYKRHLPVRNFLEFMRRTVRTTHGCHKNTSPTPFTVDGCVWSFDPLHRYGKTTVFHNHIRLNRMPSMCETSCDPRVTIECSQSSAMPTYAPQSNFDQSWLWAHHQRHKHLAVPFKFTPALLPITSPYSKMSRLTYSQIKSTNSALCVLWILKCLGQACSTVDHVPSPHIRKLGCIFWACLLPGKLSSPLSAELTLALTFHNMEFLLTKISHLYGCFGKHALTSLFFHKLYRHQCHKDGDRCPLKQTLKTQTCSKLDDNTFDMDSLRANDVAMLRVRNKPGLRY